MCLPRASDLAKTLRQKTSEDVYSGSQCQASRVPRTCEAARRKSKPVLPLTSKKKAKASVAPAPVTVVEKAAEVKAAVADLAVKAWWRRLWPATVDATKVKASLVPATVDAFFLVTCALVDISCRRSRSFR